MTSEEVQRKLGKEIATKYAWLNHSCFYGCKELGATSFKTVVQVNQNFLGADLKITMSGIKVHYDAGYGGGAKAILPGLSHIETVEHNHNVILRQTKTSGPVRIFKNEMRLDIIEAARMAKVDFSVQTMYDQKLRPTHVFAGDIVDAHHAAVRVAAKTFLHRDLPEPGYRGGQRLSAERRGVQPGEVAPLFHETRRHGRAHHPTPGGPGPDPFSEQPHRQPEWHELVSVQEQNGRFWRRPPGTEYRTHRVLPVHEPQHHEQLRRGHAVRHYMGGSDQAPESASPGTGIQVAVYPYAGLQHQMIELDG